MSVSSRDGPKLACLTCRQRKVACDRGRPQCGLCSRNGFECEYKSRQHRPGVRAGYVSRLEEQLLAVDARLKRVEAELESNRRDASQGYPAQDTGTMAYSSSPARSDPGTVPPQAYSTPGAVVNTSQTESYLDEDAVPLPGDWETLFVTESVNTWFEKCHQWFTILHERATKHAARRSDARYIHIFKAIVAVVSADDHASPQVSSISARMRDDVIRHGLGAASLRSMQSLLILTNHFYSRGELIQFGNVLAICQRMALQLGFDVLAGAQTARTMPSQVSRSAVEREEAVRAYWMTMMLESVSTMGLPSRLASTLPGITATVRLPCSESVWATSLPEMSSLATSQAQYSSTFSLCVILAVQELGMVHDFCTSSARVLDLPAWQSEAQRLDERLTNWREEFVAAVFRLINSERDYLPMGEMEPLITLANCLLNMAIIVLMQRKAPFPKEIDSAHEPWPFATSRCVYACENMAAKVRRIAEGQLDCQSPQLVMSVFSAARFYVVYSKALEADVPANLRSLAYYLHSCGKRSPLAQRLEIVIRTAVSEHRSPLAECVLPVEFYDLRFSPLEVADLLQEAAQRLDPPGSEIRSELGRGS